MARKRRLVCVAFASGVSAGTIDVRHFFHCLALDAAVLARSCQAGTNWVCALLGSLGFHIFSPGFGSREDDPGRYLRQREKAFLYTLRQLANLAHRAARTNDAAPEYPGGRFCSRLLRLEGGTMA